MKHIPRKIFLIIMATLSLAASSQDTWYGSLAGIHVMYNPAYAGVEGRETMRLSCYSFLPGKGYGLNSVFASFDTYTEGLHGGAALWAADDILGEVMNDFRSGASYSYHFRAGKELFFTAGLTASVLHRGINAGAVTLPDDLNPFSSSGGPSSETISPEGVTRFDIGAGMTVSGKKWYAGLGAMHLTTPSMNTSQKEGSDLPVLITLDAGTELTPGNGDLVITPSGSLQLQSAGLVACLGAQAGYRGVLFALAAWHAGGGFTAAEPSLGWNTGNAKIMLSYSYVIAGGNTAVNGTALIRAALSISFNNVEKRKVIHVIKLPEL